MNALFYDALAFPETLSHDAGKKVKRRKHYMLHRLDVYEPQASTICWILCALATGFWVSPCVPQTADPS